MAVFSVQCCKEKPNLENLPEWGTRVFVLHESHSKLDEKVDGGCWVGYSLDSQGHHMYWPGKCCIMVEWSWNVTFDTTVLIQQDVMAEEEQDAPGIGQNPTLTPTAPSPNTLSPDLLQGFEPETEGHSHEDWPEWDLAIQHKLAQHEQVGTWRLVKPHEDANIVGSCFIFHYKHDSNGNITSGKARLIAQGFMQEEGIDYWETFSPTAKLSAIHIITAIATQNDWELKQTDIDGTHLNAPLLETIYMCQPKGYEVPGKEKHICLLQCALYGLKQARQEWYHLFIEVMHKLRFK